MLQQVASAFCRFSARLCWRIFTSENSAFWGLSRALQVCMSRWLWLYLSLQLLQIYCVSQRTVVCCTGDSISVKDILKFPATFWLLCAVCVTYYVAVFPFVSFAPYVMFYCKILLRWLVCDCVHVRAYVDDWCVWYRLFIEQKWSMDTAEAATITGSVVV